MRECHSIVSVLDLFHNEIDDEIVTHLGEYLLDSEYLVELNIDNSKITDKGIEKLSEYIIGNITLKSLSLNQIHSITDASAPYLAQIAKQSCITSINISQTYISEEKKNEIGELFKLPLDQRDIPIKSNTKSAAKISFTSI